MANGQQRRENNFSVFIPWIANKTRKADQERNRLGEIATLEATLRGPSGGSLGKIQWNNGQMYDLTTDSPKRSFKGMH